MLETTLVHAILLERLRFRYGFSNLVLQWFTSYLVNRPQRLVLDKFSSQPRRLSCGVPQGSVLGPVLVSLMIFLQSCDSIRGSYVSNMLKCNPRKTEIIHSSTHSSPAEPIPSIKVGDCPISLSSEVRQEPWGHS